MSPIVEEVLREGKRPDQEEALRQAAGLDVKGRQEESGALLDDIDAKGPAASVEGSGEVGKTASSSSSRCINKVVVLDTGEAHEFKLATIEVHGKEKEVCKWSFFMFSVESCFRQVLLTFVEWRWFDRFILICIVINSVLLAIYDHRAGKSDSLNKFIDDVADHVLFGVFFVECSLKLVAWGCFWDKKTYLRDYWNWLDFIVVVSGIIERVGIGGSGLGFLRLFRLLRPLRSLNAVPQMKVLVNTVISSVPRLGNVALMGAFLFMIFGIIGITLMQGIFYRRCYTTADPVLFYTAAGEPDCWSWNTTDDERLCGGQYLCEDSGGYCRGHEEDGSDEYRPKFSGGRRDLPFCEHSSSDRGAMAKIAPETDFVHFDHIGGALLLIFQCMTLEGWTEIMYYVMDSYSIWIAWFYFFAMVVVTSFFLLNIALAVVDEARDAFDQEAEEEEEAQKLEEEEAENERRKSTASQEESEPQALGDDQHAKLWADNCVVRWCDKISTNEGFMNIIMLVIVGNVVVMCLEMFPPQVAWQKPIYYINVIILSIFIAEMILVFIAKGPIGYVKDPVSAFDGFVVVVSIIEMGLGGGGALRALRTLRLFRVLNKLANRITSLRVLLKAMVYTGWSLNYWVILFLLVLYIFTLMWMFFFAMKFHFDDPDSLAETTGNLDKDNWCPGTEGDAYYFRQDCIPRAHFDTFPWAFVTVYQVMTGENWNTIMYASMRAVGWWASILFVGMILFGQTLFLSLFLSMLLSKFDQVKDEIAKAEASRKRLATRKRTETSASLFGAITASISSKGLSKKKNLLDQSPLVSPRTSDDEECDEPTPVRPATPQGEDPICTPLKKVVHPEGVSADEERPVSALTLPGQLPDPASHLNPPEPPRARPSPDDGMGVRAPFDDSSFEKAAAGGKTAGGNGSSSHVLPKIPLSSLGHQSSGADSEPCAGGSFNSDDKPRKEPWPKGYAFFVLHWDNPLRVLARVVLEYSNSYGKVFDNFILVCILLSSLCMAIDTPVANPNEPLTKTIRTANMIFAIIFIIEMVVKLLAQGLIMGEGAYLKSGWNWLDCIVVMVSILDFVGPGGPAFLRTLRLLRAFRPLRVISRNENLKVVVQTVFSAIPDLGTLVIVFSLFLLIFALMLTMYYKGAFYYCEGEGIAYMRDGYPRTVPDHQNNWFWTWEPGGTAKPLVSPLCLSGDAFNQSTFASRGESGFVSLRGNWDAKARADQTAAADPRGSWQGADADDACPESTPIAWHRASADTPICEARCKPSQEISDAPGWLCPPRFTETKQLPSACVDGATAPEAGSKYYEEEQVGFNYINAMQRNILLPCGGFTTDGTRRDENGKLLNAGRVVDTGRHVSCYEAFCPDGPSPADQTEESCRSNCEEHPYFCKRTCQDENFEEYVGLGEPACEACLNECVQACLCEDFCHPLVDDAALCVEQGGEWGQLLSQNADNIWNSMVTLFEISTTEGWVDVMYAAADSEGQYRQPLRDTQAGIAIPFFVLWIFASFMFLINLSVGVIVDKYMSLKKTHGDAILKTPSQEKWIKYRSSLHGRAYFYTLTNLDKLPVYRYKLYHLITSKAFDNTIMVAIILMTITMMCQWFPKPTNWWADVLTGINYGFAVVFLVEAVLKLLALRGQYWKDAWNRFDFFCVVSAVVGLVLKYAFDLDVAKITSVVRIFRIARLFKLSPDSKRLFDALVISFPSLMNVIGVLLLLLILFSILGVNLFSTVSTRAFDTHNAHGNFKNFFWAFTTLFRASTGEAWNEVMHDLARDEVDYFRAGEWCTPQPLYNWLEEYDVLDDKCLIEKPNACVMTFWGWNPLPAFYFIMYNLVVAVMILNLVITVILDGYDEAKGSEESSIIDLCIVRWKQIDPNQNCAVSFSLAVKFINEVCAEVNKTRVEDDPKTLCRKTACDRKLDAMTFGMKRQNTNLGIDISAIPMKLAKAWDIKVQEDSTVTFISCAHQVLRFTIMMENDDPDSDVIDELLQIEDSMTTKELEQHRKLETRRKVEDNQSCELTHHIAATKVARAWEAKQKRAVAKQEVEDRKRAVLEKQERTVPHIAG